jgi:RNA polymerase sigma-70 factor (ECF subfamily)
MDNQRKYIELVTLAQKGDRESLNRLSEVGRVYLRTYVYRLTLQEDITEDIVQDTLLEMVKFIDNLKNAECFWSWLRVIAVNKMHNRNKKEGLHRAASLRQAETEYSGSRLGLSGIDYSSLESSECRQIIMESMRNLKPHHRQVLVMRCFEDLKYSQIAEEIGCKEFNARVIFYRAKNALKKQLSKRGLGKGMLLPCMYLFGQITKRAKTEVVNISAQSLAAGPIAAIIGSLFTKIGIAVTGLLVAAVVSLVTLELPTAHNDSYFAGIPNRGQVKSFYYMEQDWGKTGQFNRNLERGRSLSMGCYEQWFYFPDGVDGPMFMMMQRWDPQQKDRLCGWLQNSSAKYYYHSGRNIIHIYNYNLPLLGLLTRRLPTDEPEFTDFLDQVEGKIPDVNYFRDPNTGILMGALDNRFYNARNYKYQITYNTLEKNTFDKFRYEWPKDANLVDERDAMHKRGWTYFQITGRLGDAQIEGKGRIPFIYDELSQHWPWLKVNISQKTILVDCPSGAYVTTAEGLVTAVYPAGTFFKGLTKPWMGMHTIDLVRRDAVERRIAFSTKSSDYNPKQSQYERAEVVFYKDTERKKPLMIYTINVTADLVDKIEFPPNHDASDKTGGQLSFNYLDDISKVDSEFVEPKKIKLPKQMKTDGPGILWLIKLSQGSL